MRKRGKKTVQEHYPRSCKEGSAQPSSTSLASETAPSLNNIGRRAAVKGLSFPLNKKLLVGVANIEVRK